MDTSVVLTFLLIVVAILLFFSIQKVDQSKVRIVERLGKYNQKPLRAGIHFIIPFLEKVRRELDVSEKQTKINASKVITSDNVLLGISAVLIWRISDGARFIYRVEDGDEAIANTVQSAIRAACGNRTLDQINADRIRLATEIANQTRPKIEEWGAAVSTVEVIEVIVEDSKSQEAMQQQLAAERERRVAILEAEGAAQRTRLEAEARLYEAEKKAQAVRVEADAQAYAIRTVAEATAFKLSTEGNALQGNGAAVLEADVRIKQIQAFGQMAMGEASKLVVVPGELTQAAADIAKALKLRS